MKQRLRKTTLLKIVGTIALTWIILTLLAQRKGPENTIAFGKSTSPKKALIVYNPDLFYNLDEQVCKSFAEALADNGWYSKVVTVATAETLGNEGFHLYVFCANTYNWAPDRPTANFIKNHISLAQKQVVAITLGSGSTRRAQNRLENLIGDKDANLIGSKTFWLMRPNDESRIEEPNTQVAVDMAYEFGKQISLMMKNVKV